MTYELIRPLLFAVDAERMHHLAVRTGRLIGDNRLLRRLLTRLCQVDSDRLRVRALGIDFPSPLGVAAGFDKNGALVPIFAALGFGFAEVGTVTPRPWDGNPRPRVFRLPADDALVNRLGLPNLGAAAVARRLCAVRRIDGCRIPIGVNVGRVNDDVSAPGAGMDAAIADYVEAVRAVRAVADYVAVNVSCPNTEDGRTFEHDLTRLDALLAAVAAELQVPFVVKLSPDATWAHTRDMADVALARGAAGFVLTNTTRAREDLATSNDRVREIGRGGLSGRPLRRRANLLMRQMRRHVKDDVTLIGVGGIFDARDVAERMEAGANLVQMYTGLVYGGPFIARTILRALSAG